MMHVRIPETIAAAPVGAVTADVTAEMPASAPPPSLPALDWKAPSLWDAPLGDTRVLNDKHWNTHRRVQFTPERFVVLPEALKMVPVGSRDWRDPLGSNVTRVNATLLPLAPKDAASASSRTPTTNWSRMLSEPAVLQMQAPLDKTSHAAGGTACALMLGKVTDLIVVDGLAPVADDAPAKVGKRAVGKWEEPALEVDCRVVTPGGLAPVVAEAASNEQDPALSGAQHVPSGPSAQHVPSAPSALRGAPRVTAGGEGFPVGYALDNPVVGPLVDKLEFAFPPGSPFTRVSTTSVEPTPPKAGLPRGSLKVELSAADGSHQSHDVRTFLLNLHVPDWPRQLMFALGVQWLHDKSQPLNLAVMCKDGASASGVVAIALHGMQCLEAFNRGEIHLTSVDDLAERLDDFMKAAGQHRSPSFAQPDRYDLNTRELAYALWDSWTQVLSNPNSTAVKQFRREIGQELPEGEVPEPSIAVAKEAERAVRALGKAAVAHYRNATTVSVDSGVVADASPMGTLSSLQRQTDLTNTPDPFDASGASESALIQAGRSTMTSPTRSPSSRLADSGTSSTSSRPITAATQSTVLDRSTRSQPDAETRPGSSRAPGAVKPQVPQGSAPLQMPPNGDGRTRYLHAYGKAHVGAVQANLARLQATTPQVNERSVNGAPEAARADTPGELMRALIKAREAATGGDRSALDSIPQAIVKRWSEGGACIDIHRDRVKGLVREMTAWTGTIGNLRSRVINSQNRLLEPHTRWAQDLIKVVQDDLREHAQTQSGASDSPAKVDEAQVAQLARHAIKTLLAEHFVRLSAKDQERWRHRVTGHSDRFELALSNSLAKVKALPGRLHLNGPQTSEEASDRPPLFPWRKADRQRTAALVESRKPAPSGEDMVRKAVDHEWATRWVLELTREVAGVKP